MTFTVQISQEGNEKLYFRIVEEDGSMYAERPYKASVEIEVSSDMITSVVRALVAIKREEEKWKAIQAGEIQTTRLSLST